MKKSLRSPGVGFAVRNTLLQSVEVGSDGKRTYCCILRIAWQQKITNEEVYSELVVGKRNRCRPKLRFKDVCKHDLKSLNIRSDELEL